MLRDCSEKYFKWLTRSDNILPDDENEEIRFSHFKLSYADTFNTYNAGAPYRSLQFWPPYRLNI